MIHLSVRLLPFSDTVFHIRVGQPISIFELFSAAVLCTCSWSHTPFTRSAIIDYWCYPSSHSVQLSTHPSAFLFHSTTLLQCANDKPTHSTLCIWLEWTRRTCMDLSCTKFRLQTEQLMSCTGSRMTGDCMIRFAWRARFPFARRGDWRSLSIHLLMGRKVEDHLWMANENGSLPFHWRCVCGVWLEHSMSTAMLAIPFPTDVVGAMKWLPACTCATRHLQCSTIWGDKPMFAQNDLFWCDWSSACLWHLSGFSAV